MKLTIIVLLAAVNLMVSADVTSDDNVAKGKREAPMAEPSTDYTPPRLEAPYATYSPIIAGANAPQPSFYQQSPFNQGPSSATPYEYNRYTGVIPLPSVEGNDIGAGENGLNYGGPYNQGYGNGFPGNGYPGASNSNGATNSYGNYIKYGQNSNGNPATSYAQLNGLGQSLTVYDANKNVYDNNGGGYEQYSTIRGSQFGNGGGNYENSFYGNPSFGGSPDGKYPSPSFVGSNDAKFSPPPFTGSPDAKYPSSAALVSNEPGYASGIKGLRHYSQQLSPLNTQSLKNSRPVALTPPHLTRKQPSFLTDQRNPNFRPSFLLGSSVLSSTPDYNQPQLTSLGELSSQYIQQNPNIQEHYAAPPSLGSLPLQSPFNQGPANFANGYQSGGNLGQILPSTSYSLPETLIYTKSSLYNERYGQTQQ